MIGFVRARGLSMAAIALVMLLVSAMQTGISYSAGHGPLRRFDLFHWPQLMAGFYLLRLALFALLLALWLCGRKRTLFRAIVAVNLYLTLVLVLDTAALVWVLGGFRQAAQTMLADAALMCLSNILIFSIWYWIIDPPGVEEPPHEEAPWAFLFPQRSLASHAAWVPDYPDYLFLAFTTSFAFSPTDALPLTRTAKMLMLLQAAISVVIVLGIAGGAINAVVGG